MSIRRSDSSCYGTSDPKADGERSAVLKVGDQDMNVFYHPDSVLADKETPAAIDHFCFSMEAASVEQLIGDLRHAGIDMVKGPVERRNGTSVLVYDPDDVHVELRIESARAAE
jgi:hypothetical protein